jgi:hypothetical protein
MNEFQIDDMTSNRGAAAIARAVQSLDGSATIRIDFAAKCIRVESPIGPYKLAAAIRSVGFTPASVLLGADASRP